MDTSTTNNNNTKRTKTITNHHEIQDQTSSTTTAALHSTLHHPTSRNWLEPHLHSSQLMYPIFVRDQPSDKIINGFEPNQQWGYDKDYRSLIAHLSVLMKKGLTNIMLFGVVTNKDEIGSSADMEKNPVVLAMSAIRKVLPDLFLAADVCLCEYTSHGHCGLLRSIPGNNNEEEKIIDNDATCARLADIALVYARAGAHMVCPSDMMDSRVKAIREQLTRNGFAHVMIMAYTSKKASSFYAPFRQAVESTFKGNRMRYQHPIGAFNLSLRALKRDEEEGADIVIVKPGLFYGDLIKTFSEQSLLPIAVYIVSGEYVMLKSYADRIGDLETVLKESHISMIRAGAQILITYFTPQLLQMIEEKKL
jgi:porphobilinogen synthase